MTKTTQYDFLIYGSYGYTGNLICRLAKEKGMKPLIAGRNEAKIKAQSEEYGFDYRVFEVHETEKVLSAIESVKVLLHCGGPFSETARPMAEACLKTRTHYLDITGEWSVFEAMASLDKAAKEAGIVIMPGVGYDVVPSDCLSLYLKEQLPDAVSLSLGIFSKGGKMSRGTLLTMNESLGHPAVMRKGGKIISVPVANFVKEVVIGSRKMLFMNIGWGDVATAWYSTGIPEIITYTGASKEMIRTAKLNRYFGFLLRIPFIKSISESRIRKRGNPISEEMRQSARAYVWGEVVNARQEKKSALLSLPDGYVLTARTALSVVERMLTSPPPVGFQTPAKAFGSGFILTIPETERKDLP
ncbi:MAG: saccharopine dehydrogenase NADP-binding domain-containing protein [Bacteroidia bacterium]|nr:saccharopine dehydrogenase NADP-binding domain-containing protein [Bacteroidia bacterium]